MEWLAEPVKAAGASELALAAFLSIAAAGICYKFFSNAPVRVRLIAFFSILVFAFILSMLIIGRSAGGQAGSRPDQLNLIKLLGAFPEAERFEKCVLIEQPPTCETLVATIAGLGLPPASGKVQEEVSEALTRGEIPKTLVQKVSTANIASGTAILTLGKANGYDIDFFWCQTGTGAQDYATRLAKQLTAAGKIDGEPLGRVRVRALAETTKSRAEYAEHRMTVGAEASELKIGQELANFLNSHADERKFSVIETGFKPTPYYLSVFVCDAKPALRL